MSSLVSRWWDSDVGYSFRSSPTAIVAAAIALVCVFGAVFAHWVAPHNPLDLTTLELSDARLPTRPAAAASTCWAPTIRAATSCRR